MPLPKRREKMCKFQSILMNRLFSNRFHGLFIHLLSKSASNQPKKSHATVLKPLIKAFGVTFAFASILEFVEVMLQFASPQLLREIVKFVQSRGSNATQSIVEQNLQSVVYSPMWHGIFYAVLLFAVATIKTLCAAQYNKHMVLIGLRIRTALVGVIYQKSLCLSNTARKAKTVGEIVNLMAVDTLRLKDLTTYINMVWSSPVQIIFAIYFLYDLLGAAIFAGKIN